MVREAWHEVCRRGIRPEGVGEIAVAGGERLVQAVEEQVERCRACALRAMHATPGGASASGASAASAAAGVSAKAVAVSTHALPPVCVHCAAASGGAVPIVTTEQAVSLLS